MFDAGQRAGHLPNKTLLSPQGHDPCGHGDGWSREGRFQRYRANILLMLELIAYLTEECCRATPGLCLLARGLLLL